MRRPFLECRKQPQVVFSPFHGDAEIIDAEAKEVSQARMSIFFLDKKERS
jgi:hypothetical protein